MWRLQKYKNMQVAKAYILAVGVNDLRVLTDDEIVSNYKTILNLFPPDTPLIVSCILPVIEHQPTNFSIHYQQRNERIKIINNKILDLCKSSPRIKVLNAFDSMCDETNNLRQDYTIDGIHLSFKGYKMWAKLLKDKLNEALKNREK
ncbi:MAG: GDSL-type esterase/lipase family protein [Thermoguttaceae bacterium]